MDALAVSEATAAQLDEQNGRAGTDEAALNRVPENKFQRAIAVWRSESQVSLK
jgi:hypothetical protein